MAVFFVHACKVLSLPLMAVAFFLAIKSIHTESEEVMDAAEYTAFTAIFAVITAYLGGPAGYEEFSSIMAGMMLASTLIFFPICIREAEKLDQN